jgi:hypothetical protein
MDEILSRSGALTFLSQFLYNQERCGTLGEANGIRLAVKALRSARIDLHA